MTTLDFCLLNELISSPDFAGVGMHYDPNILFKEKGPIGGSHVSVIIGRKYDNEAGRCLVLIRDSYGSDCKALGLNIKYKNCESGQHWIPIEDVINSSVSLTYFDYHRSGTIFYIFICLKRLHLSILIYINYFAVT